MGFKPNEQPAIATPTGNEKVHVSDANGDSGSLTTQQIADLTPTGATPALQAVTDVGATTTNEIISNVPAAGDTTGGRVLSDSKSGALIQMGEYSDNDTVITTDDGAFLQNYLYIGTAEVDMIKGNDGFTIDSFITPTNGIKVLSTGGMLVKGLPTYADDAAAGVGGLPTDAIYKTATGELRIKL